MTFSEKLIEARLALNLSQLELADAVGVSERSIFAYEQEGTSPRTAVLIKLAEALHVTVTYLIDDSVTNKKASISEEIFVAEAKNTYGSKGAREAQEILSKTSALFAGGELSEEAKEMFIQSMQEVFMESKAEAREKFTPKRRKRRKA